MVFEWDKVVKKKADAQPSEPSIAEEVRVCVCVVVCAGFATPAQSLKHEGSPYRGLHESVN